ncbi:MAG: two-component system response regulator NarL [Betaproteobacteria bacterium]|nr:two-component system response regulator NarL [Betaproteobacteria bacterium]
MSTRILLIDDHPLFRRGVAQLLAAEADFLVVGEAGDGETGIELATALQPDVILLDLNMKGTDGLETLRKLKASGIAARCIMLTVSGDEQHVLSAMRSGADGYLLKDMEPEELARRVRQSVVGGVVLDGAVAGILAQALNAPQPPEKTTLTERESQILGQLAEGRCNKDIARLLGISDATVKVHIKHLLRKLNMKSRLEAAVWALHNL